MRGKEIRGSSGRRKEKREKGLLLLLTEIVLSTEGKGFQGLLNNNVIVVVVVVGFWKRYEIGGDSGGVHGGRLLICLE